MSLRMFTRRLLSLASVWNCGQLDRPSSHKARLNLELCEDRTVPVTYNFDGTTLTATLNNPIDGGVAVQTPVGGFVTLKTIGTGVSSAPISTSALKQIVVDATQQDHDGSGISAATELNPTNMPALRQVVFKASSHLFQAADYSNFNFGPVAGTGTAPSVYFVTQLGSAAALGYAAPKGGVSVVQFADQAAANFVTISTNTAGPNSMTFLDFGNVSSAVQVNLNAQQGGILASYANYDAILFHGTAVSLYGARGGKGDNTFVSSGVQDQYFIGGFGNNTFSLSGAGKTVEVASVYDLSPSLAGVLQTAGNYAGTYGLSLNATDLANASDIVDLTQFQSKVSAFAANDTNLFKTASTLFAKFGMFDMGGNAPGFAADPKQSITAPQLSGSFNVTVNAGTANADVFGYVNVALTAVGGGGNNDFESATGALQSFLSAGGGTSLLEGNAGDTLVAGSGKTTIQFFADQASPTRVTRLVGGTGTGSVSATSKFITVDVGTGTYDLNGIINDSSVILIYDHQTTLNGANISANPGMIPSAVQKITR